MQPRPPDSLQTPAACVSAPLPLRPPRFVVAVCHFPFFSRPLDPWFLFDCGFFLFNASLLCFSFLAHSPFGATEHTLSPRRFFFPFLQWFFFFFFFVSARLTLFGIIVTSAQGGLCARKQKTPECPVRAFFVSVFVGRRGPYVVVPHFSDSASHQCRPPLRRGTTHTQKESLPAFFRRAVVVFKSCVFFFSLFFSLSPLASCSLFLYLFFTFATSLGLLLLLCSSQNILGGFFFRKRVRVTRCISHIATSNPPVLQPLWDELLRVSWAAGHYVFTQLPARVGRVAGCCHGALIGSAHGSARCQTKGACCAWMLRSRTMSMYKFMVAKLGSEGIFETEKQTVCTWSTGNRPRVIFIFSVQKKKKKCCGSWETVLRNLGGDLSTLRHSPQAFCRLSLAWILEYSTTRKYI